MKKETMVFSGAIIVGLGIVAGGVICDNVALVFLGLFIALISFFPFKISLK